MNSLCTVSASRKIIGCLTSAVIVNLLDSALLFKSFKKYSGFSYHVNMKALSTHCNRSWGMFILILKIASSNQSMYILASTGDRDDSIGKPFIENKIARIEIKTNITQCFNNNKFSQ